MLAFVWLCCRCSSEVMEEDVGCSACPYPIEVAAIERIARRNRLNENVDGRDPKRVVAAQVIGARSCDMGKRSAYRVELARADGAKFGYDSDGYPKRELLGAIVVATLVGDRIHDWTIEEEFHPPAHDIAPDFTRGPSQVPASVAWPVPSVPGVPDGYLPRRTPTGQLVGEPIDPLRDRVRSAATHARLAETLAQPVSRTLDIHWRIVLALAIGALGAVGCWIYLAVDPPPAENLTALVIVASCLSVLFGGLLVVPTIVRLWRRWHAPITRAVAGVVDVRRTEDSSHRGIRRAALAFADDTIRDYELLPRAARAATPGTVGVACFRQHHVMAFLPLDGA